MKDKTFDDFWEELKAESPEIRKELEEAEKNSELMMDIMVAVRNLLDEKDIDKCGYFEKDLESRVTMCVRNRKLWLENEVEE